MTKPYSKLKLQANHARQNRLQKRSLLPLSKEAVDAMAMQYHTALAALKAKQGSKHGVRILLQMVVVAGFIGDATAVRIDPDVLIQLDGALCDALDHGEDTGNWLVNDTIHDLCAALLVEHERQLRVVPVNVLREVLDRATRFRNGERYGSSRN
ncbi:Fis family transcriptional regulator [Burkholderia gladioli]|uniref:Fis family transcriptional regulator n=1 Tax=Burkholderia gladioli TaxID=28095 RepID=UPI00163FB663|nr:Fis family transcriptional regulator [Burkholderia gladioli]